MAALGVTPSRDANGELMMRLPWGARVVRESADVVHLPDGRSGPVFLLPDSSREPWAALLNRGDELPANIFAP